MTINQWEYEIHLNLRVDKKVCSCESLALAIRGCLSSMLQKEDVTVSKGELRIDTYEIIQDEALNET